MVAAYLTLAAWFAAADLFAAWAGGMKLRPVAAVLLALVWPLSVAFAMVASAIIIGRLRAATSSGAAP